MSETRLQYVLHSFSSKRTVYWTRCEISMSLCNLDLRETCRMFWQLTFCSAHRVPEKKQCINACMIPLIHPPYTFITTQCTYWVLIQPDQRGIITRISKWRLHWVGTTHTNKTLYTRLQFLMFVWECVRLDLECELHCTVYLDYAHQCSCNSVSHRHSAIQQMMDVKWSANNYPLYVDDGGRPSSSWSSISPPVSFFFFVICILSLTHTVFFS